jgi:hypothetical protein
MALARLLDDSDIDCGHHRFIFALGYRMGYTDAVEDIAGQMTPKMSLGIRYWFNSTQRADLFIRGMAAFETRL